MLVDVYASPPPCRSQNNRIGYAFQTITYINHHQHGQLRALGVGRKGNCD